MGQCIWNSPNSYRTPKKERTFERLWSFWNDWFSGSMLISVTPAKFDHFWVYPKLDNPPTPQKSSSRRVLEFFVNQPKVQVIPILKFSLQNYLWFHVPPSPTWISPSPWGASPDGSWCGAHSEAHDEWPGVKNVIKTSPVVCLFVCRFQGSKGSKDGRRFFSPDFLSVVLFHEYRCFKKLFESQKATSYMNSCWLRTWCDVARKYGVEHGRTLYIAWKLYHGYVARIWSDHQ